MEKILKKYNYVSFIAIFILLPIIFFLLGDFAQRKILKDILSIITILAFSLMIGQFFLSRSNTLAKTTHKIKDLVNIHKIIGYFTVSVIIFHPLMIVVPRYFEVGADPIESFVKMITTFESLGVILGLIAWVSMFILGATSMFRDKLNMKYKTWRVFHGVLSIVFIAITTWHAIDLGRHSSLTMSSFYIITALFGSYLILKLYVFKKGEKDAKQ